MRISDWSSDVCSSDLLEQTNDTAAIFSLSIPIPMFNNGWAALSQATAERQSADARRRLQALDVDQAIARAQADAANAAPNAAAARGPALAAAADRKSRGEGIGVAGGECFGGRRTNQKKRNTVNENN